MTDHELLLSISQIMDKKIKPLEYRMDSMEHNLKNDIEQLDAKIDTVEQNLKSDINRLDAKIDTVEQNLKSNIDHLGSAIHTINLKLENIFEPRLYEIENCYLSTFERYKINGEKIEKMETDITIIQDVLMEHGSALQILTA